MIAFECVRPYRLLDAGVILFGIITWTLSSYLIDIMIGNNMLKLILILFAGNFILAILWLLINKCGISIIYYVSSALLMMNIQPFEGFGWSKVYIMLIAAIVFEFMFVSLKLEISRVPIDILTGTILSNFSMPLSATLFSNTIVSSLNLALTFAFDGMIAAIAAIAFWLIIRNTRFVLRFEYEI
jgi:hypothetical protein